MPISPINSSSLPLNLAQFKGQALASLFDSSQTAWSSFPPAGAISPFNRLNNALLEQAPASTLDTLSGSPNFSSVLDQFSTALRFKELPTSTTPTGLDSSQPFSTPGQNMVTVLNRVEVSFKAQFTELGHMRTSLAGQQQAAQSLASLDAQASNADIKAALDRFVASYNAGVERFATDVARGGILEGSWEAERARFATRRDIDYVLNGNGAGVKGGLAAIGISTDPVTGLASIDQAKLDSALTRDKAAHLAAITEFATSFVGTVEALNATNHAQQRQMANLDRAVHWIDANKASVQKEFGPGAAATPNEAFAKAAAQYDAIALGR